MSRSNSDDFFGIEVDSIHYEKKKNITETENTSVANKNSKISGSDFLEDAICPGLRERAEQFEKSENNNLNDTVRFEKDSMGYINDRERYTENFSSNQEQYSLNSSSQVFSKHFEDIHNNEYELHDNSEIIEIPKKRNQRMKPNKFENHASRFNQASLHDEQPPAGLSELWSNFPDLRFISEMELVEFMARRMLYADNNLIAFDKPYGLPYSGGRDKSLQFDRIIQQLKSIVAPKVERLHLIKSNDKYHSGILLFGTSSAVQKDVKEMINSDMVEQKFRCIVRGGLDDTTVNVTIPLVRMIRNGDLKLQPLVTNKAKYPIEYVKSEAREINSTSIVSDLEITVRKDCAHQIRSHMSLIGCPLLGDDKYGNDNGSMRYSGSILNMLNMTKSQSKKLPLVCHFKEVNLPPLSGSQPITISSPLPQHYLWMLKRLRLFKFLDNLMELYVCSYKPQFSSSTMIVRLPCVGNQGKQILYLAAKDEKRFKESIRSYLNITENFKLVVKIKLNDGFIENVDNSWEWRVLSYLKKMLEMERLLWCLSSLGGAYSAMGDYDIKFAETAAEISKSQLAIATEIGDPAIIARCHLYIALSEAQRGRCRKAAYIVKMIYDWSKENNEELVKKCCTGVFNKVLSINIERKLKT